MRNNIFVYFSGRFSLKNNACKLKARTVILYDLSLLVYLTKITIHK